MDDREYLYNGWEFTAKIVGSDFASDEAERYVSEIQEAIKNLEKGIMDLKSNQSDASLGGFLAEEWHARTFSLDAIADGSINRAVRLGVTGYGSEDIITNFDKSYSSKYMATAEKSATAQAILHRDNGTPLYEGQQRLIPTDHLDDAIKHAHNQAMKNADIRPDVSNAYADTEINLVDRISDSEGHESRPLTKADDLKMARDVKNDRFKAENYGVDLDSVIKTEYMIEQALKAGITAATISIAMQVTPEIVKAIDYLVKNGELDLKQVQKIGTKAISSGAEGFMRGSIACTLQIICEKGVLGEAFVHADPTLVGTLVVIVLQTVKNSILVASGKMTPREMGMAFVDSVVMGAGFWVGITVGKKIGAAIGTVAFIEAPILGYVIGSLIGCSCAIVYQVSKKQLISFCVDTGFTCFGLVEQDYQLPEEALKDLGIDLAEIEHATLETTPIDKTDVSDIGMIENVNIETVNIVMIRRGVIGVNKIGYII